jgi:hypothetical protein
VTAPETAAAAAAWTPRPAGRSAIGPVAIAITLSAIALLMGVRGSDLAAQVYRVNLFRTHGFVVWDDLWYAGHATLSYSALSPVFSALAGPVALGAASSAVSAWCVDRLLRAHFGAAASLGSLWFAMSTVTNVAVGRITFAFGMAIGLAALLALTRGRPRIAAALGLGCALASPVAAVFLVLAAAAWGIPRRSRWWHAAAVMGAATLPLAAIAIAFPGGGIFPFERASLLWNLGICLAVYLCLPREQIVLRLATVAYAVANLALYEVHNPLGGNFLRLSQYGAGPVLACVLVGRRRLLLLPLAIPLLVWQWVPAVDGITARHRDPSTTRAFYDPLLHELDGMATGPIRVEIPTTRHHWESAYIAGHHSLARGWESQLDRGYNPIFYDGSLDATTYHRWLTDQGVTFVALPDAPLDASATGEAALLRGELPFLTPVWQNRDWQVWKVGSSPGLVTGSAALTTLGPDSFTLRVDRPGDVVVRLRASGHWAIDGPGCTSRTPAGWLVLRGLPAGEIKVDQSLGGDHCRT